MNIYDEEWICEAHPDKPFPHDGCSGPGMLSDESCAMLAKEDDAQGRRIRENSVMTGGLSGERKSD